ncbi:protein disulfide-isomerase-like [Symsagittifera roscoffensis]|uniref:protein disulfide-isomerase-like n=1 Tax=Symsagittifera roscoffensis TaxID=84072 RepID=UPI00307B417F
MISVCVALSFVGLVLAEVEVNKDGVLVLTTDTFQEALDSADYVLVEFYAPWCGHCKALAPEWAKAAQKLLSDYPDLSVKLAMVDATVESSLAKDHGVRGYPTIKFFRKEAKTEPKDYSGGRQANDIVNWLLKKTGPPAVDLTSVEEAEKFIDAEKIAVIGFFEKSDSDAAKAFISAAQAKDDVKFAISTVVAVREKYEVAADKVVVFRKFDEPQVVFEGEMTAEELKSFVAKAQLPYIIEFSDETAPQIFGGDIKTHALFFCNVKEATEMLEEFKKAAKGLKGKAVFVYLDIAKDSNARVMEFFNLKAEDGTQLRVIKMGGDMKKFKADLTEFTEATFTAFVQDVLDGKVQRHLMSEEIAEGWDKEPVKVLVGKNFEEVAMDKTKDVLVEFYAPWCGHCKALAPIYDELGAHFQDSTDVVIAKVDSTKNEVSAVDVQGFPTIYLFRKKDNKAILYNGGRTLEALKSFVESRGEVQKEDEEGAEEEEEDEEEGEGTGEAPTDDHSKDEL